MEVIFFMLAGNIAFMIMCSAMVFFMTPGLAFFYGGMVRRKNVVNTILSSFFICGLASAMWIAFGYSISFSGDVGGLGIIGNLKNFCLEGVSLQSPDGESIPDALFCVFQMMFAIITPALITGSLIGRMKFSKLIMFIAIWSLIVYYPLAHMQWGGGLLDRIGAIDFAGGNVVHISSGVSGLVASIVLGKRRGYGAMEYRPHNVPFIVLGAAILWFGWFGFNAGSSLAADGLAVHAFITTNTSAAMGLLSWMLIEGIILGKPTATGAATGAVLGLVAITPGAGYVPIWASFIIGALVSPICYFAISKVKAKFGYDDALDAFGCHGVGGIWGGIATGIFATHQVNDSTKYQGLITGDYRLFLAQIGAVLITAAFAGIATFIIMNILKACGGVRISTEDEAVGMDISQHEEKAYPAFTGLD